MRLPEPIGPGAVETRSFALDVLRKWGPERLVPLRDARAGAHVPLVNLKNLRFGKLFKSDLEGKANRKKLIDQGLSQHPCAKVEI